MLKIFVTGDNHIGLRYVKHKQAKHLASVRTEDFNAMVDAANRESCALFAITGDLFDNTYGVSKGEIKTLLDTLSRFNGIVAVLPGNHDYYDKEAKAWHYFEDVMKAYDNILLLCEYKPYEITANGEAVVIYPALCKKAHSEPGENNLGWIKNTEIANDEAYRIGMAHGAVEGETIDSEGVYFLMKRSELESIPVDAWLIGHTHVPFPKNLTEDFANVKDRIFNAGTHAQTDVSCNTEGICFVVEIDDKKNVRAKKVRSGSIRFYKKEISVTAGEMEHILSTELSEIQDSSVVDLTVKGAVTAEEYENRYAIIEKVLSRFIEGNPDDNALSRLISQELIEREFPETSFSAGLLTALLDEPKEAQLAYELLKSLKEGK